MGYDAVQVVDPVFLLSRETWNNISVDPETEDYVLVYDFLHNDPNIEALARHFAQTEGLRIVAVNDKGSLSYADRNVSNAGPAEFLGYIRRARHVLASSFHAAAFSTIFERDFYIFPMKGHGNSSRMTDFLNSIGLTNRFITEITAVEGKRIDFSRVNMLLEKQVDASRLWLKRQMENTNNTLTWK